MKSIGMVRKVDELGRIVLPIETRRQLDLEPKDGVEIFVDEERIILKKYQPCCVFCGEADNVTLFKGKLVCAECIKALSAAVEPDPAAPTADRAESACATKARLKVL